LEGRDLVTTVYLSSRYAEPILVKLLHKKLVRWRYEQVYGLPRPGRTLAQEAENLWARRPWTVLVEWPESFAHKQLPMDDPSRSTKCSITVIGIRVAREDILKHLPKLNSTAETAKLTTKEWVMAEAKRMKAAREIPDRISNFARELGRRMKAAAKENDSIKPVEWPHIKNELPGWGLWPSSKIK
jgi:hypothetical protein